MNTNTTKYLLIGGGISCASAAAKIREIDPSGAITMVCGEPHAPYDRPPLTKSFMQGKMPAQDVFLHPFDWYYQNHVELLPGQLVKQLDTANRVATLSSGLTIKYEKALLATGGRPRRLKVPGEDLPGVFHFRTMDDAIAVSSSTARAKRAVIIGGGFIGMELASSLTQRGLGVDVVVSGERIWSHFCDPRLSRYFQQYFQDHGVTFHLQRTVKAIRGEQGASSVELVGGQSLPCDMVIIAVGIDLNLELATKTGLKIDNGVIVDERMRTSAPNVFAAGDIINYPDPYSHSRRRVEHWGQAEYTGGLAGANMAGDSQRYDLLTYVFSDLFDLHLEFAGDERRYDWLVLRGSMEGNSFGVLYLDGPNVTAYFSVNLKKKQYTPLGKLIEQKVDVTGKERQLQDINFDVTQWLQVPVGK